MSPSSMAVMTSKAFCAASTKCEAISFIKPQIEPLCVGPDAAAMDAEFHRRGGLPAFAGKHVGMVLKALKDAAEADAAGFQIAQA